MSQAVVAQRLGRRQSRVADVERNERGARVIGVAAERPIAIVPDLVYAIGEIMDAERRRDGGDLTLACRARRAARLQRGGDDVTSAC